jgi:hypothetical protein
LHVVAKSKNILQTSVKQKLLLQFANKKPMDLIGTSCFANRDDAKTLFDFLHSDKSKSANWNAPLVASKLLHLYNMFEKYKEVLDLHRPKSRKTESEDLVKTLYKFIADCKKHVVGDIETIKLKSTRKAAETKGGQEITPFNAEKHSNLACPCCDHHIMMALERGFEENVAKNEAEKRPSLKG